MPKHLKTQPVIAGSTEATHWTCPGASRAEMTHHLKNGVCLYCKSTQRELVARHEKILEAS